ncbi:MAG: ribbon-helix-helix domain-containing protein [Deltaproteobacteria bacterium]|nr:ribbon-helix-helix domain-containing protein [Deltaproteobacteria bacterium]
MVRTQIQITNEQAKSLRLLASRLNVSQAELIRRSIDRLLATEVGVSLADKKKRAIAAVGRYASDRDDVSERHDDYLADAFKS